MAQIKSDATLGSEQSVVTPLDHLTDFLVALENSDITANAFEGSGGRVNITAQGIFGTGFRQ